MGNLELKWWMLGCSLLEKLPFFLTFVSHWCYLLPPICPPSTVGVHSLERSQLKALTAVHLCADERMLP